MVKYVSGRIVSLVCCLMLGAMWVGCDEGAGDPDDTDTNTPSDVDTDTDADTDTDTDADTDTDTDTGDDPDTGTGVDTGDDTGSEAPGLCEDSPCVHGHCVVMTADTPTCVCDSGWTGDDCTTEVDPCIWMYCENGGTCVHDTDGLSCDCPAGITGEYCQINIDDCAGHGCVNGLCVDALNSYTCKCDLGWTGSLCDATIDTDNATGTEWISIPGGTFDMGGDMWGYEQPIHSVTVPAFEMLKTEVTVAQYGECLDAGVCTEIPGSAQPEDNWGDPGYENHPINEVSWEGATWFCAWIGARLPTEAEWEYAARGGGQDIEYPWGNETPTCEYAVMFEGGYGCGTGRTAEVCSKPLGNTAQGLCDMAGNLYEWVEDKTHSNYIGAPTDGSAWIDGDIETRIMRGGCFGSTGLFMRVAHRSATGFEPREITGFRCAR